MAQEHVIDKDGLRLTILEDGHPAMVFESSGPGAFTRVTGARIEGGKAILTYSDGNETGSMSMQDLLVSYPGYIYDRSRSLSLKSILEERMPDKKDPGHHDYRAGYRRQTMIVHSVPTPTGPKTAINDQSVWRQPTRIQNYKQKSKYARKRPKRR